ncbi:MAG: hypothetical protein JW940_04240 [Polyangiaceae bacterium]|nr:hypothetical protein [Polyangiaceae bacterium]
MATAALATLLTSSPARAEPSDMADRGAGSDNDGAECTATEDQVRRSCGANPACNAAPEDPPTVLHRSAAVAAGLVPGLLVHGAGSFVLGRPCTARRLLAAEGIGIGLLAVGGGAIVLSGAARDIVGPAAALSIAGLGLFSLSALADLYSVTAPQGGWGKAPTGVPRWETSLGYRYVYDPQFSYRHFLVDTMHVRAGRWRLSPSVWMSSDDANERMRLVTALRPWGPTPDERARDGSFADAEFALTHHRFAREGFDITTVEAFALGRFDLERFDAGLSGSFADFGVGAATQVYDWETDAGNRQSTTMLLARFGFGAYLGKQAPSGGHVLVYYDHRHDGYAGGFLNLGVGSGVAGHFGLQSVYYFDDRYGLQLEAQLGSAWVAGLSARFRAGGAP